MKRSLFFTLVLLACKVLYAQETAEISKTGWLIYYGDKIVWVESKLKNNVDNNSFYKQAEYLNGLIVNYIPEALYYKSIAKSYEIKALQLDTTTKKADYTLKDSIRILPVKVKFRCLSRPVSELLTPMGLSFKRERNEITMQYNFETSYDLREVELLRAADKKKLKRVKNYQVYPPH